MGISPVRANTYEVTVQLYLRVRLPDGSYPYLKAPFASNGRLRPHHAFHDGKAVHFLGSSYYLRFRVDGKRVWEPAGSDPSLAVVTLQKKTHALQGAALGLTAPVPVTPVFQPEAHPPSDGKAKRPFADSVAGYLAETEEHKSKKTLDAYRLTVTAFTELVDRHNLEDLIAATLNDYSQHQLDTHTVQSEEPDYVALDMYPDIVAVVTIDRDVRDWVVAHVVILRRPLRRGIRWMTC